MKNNNREVITLLAKNMYQANVVRNRILITAITFVVIMLFGVFGLSVGKIETDYLLYVRNSGTTAYTTLERATEEQCREIEGLDYIKETGTVVSIGYTDDFAAEVLDTNAYEKIQKPAYTDIHGTYPEAKNEVMLPMRALEQMGISKPAVGMEIPLKIALVNESIMEEDFRLSGYYTEYVDPMISAPRGYFSRALLDSLELDVLEHTTLLIKQKDTITGENIEERLYKDVTMADDSQQFFGENTVTYQAVFDLTGGFDTGILMAVVILTGAYLLIHNVLQISLSRDIRQYGLLKVLGTTGVQLRKVVYRQVWKMAVIGSLTGSVAGSILMVTVVPKLLSGMYLYGLGEASSMIAFKPWILILAVLFSIAVTFLSASTAMRKIVKMTPMEAAKFSEADAGKQKKIRRSTTGGNLVQMAWRNIIRLKKRVFFTVCSLFLGLVMALGAVVISTGTDNTNRIEYENADFNIQCQMSSMQASQYDAEENYFPEELCRKMEGLKGVTKSVRIKGGYGYVSKEEKALELFMKEKEPALPYYETVVQVIESDYLEKLEKFSRKEGLNLDIEALKKGEGVLLFHYNLLSQIQREESLQYTGMPVTFYNMKQEKKGEMKLAGYLNVKQKRLPKLNTTWNGPDILYFLVSEKGFEKMGLPEQNFGMKLTVKPKAEPVIKERLNQMIDERNGIFRNLQEPEFQDARSLRITAKSDILKAEKDYIVSSRIVMGALCGILILMGLANYVNVTMTGLTQRKKEFAVMQSIGMTRKQLRKMLVLEGIFYSCVIIGLLITAGSFCLAGIACMMTQRIAYFHFIYPFWSLFLCIAVLFVSCTGIPLLMYGKSRKIFMLL